MKVEPDSIYLIPPNKSMGIQNSALYLQEPAQPPGLRLPVDFFFRSPAKEKGADAICVILSGTGTDGTLGLRAIKAELGTAFVQDPESAKYDGMPRSAVGSGLAERQQMRSILEKGGSLMKFYGAKTTVSLISCLTRYRLSCLIKKRFKRSGITSAAMLVG
jgi:chemotaxis response regulator CheB